MTAPEAEPLPEINHEDPAIASIDDAAAQHIAALEAQASQFKDQWLRAVAETENLRKRAERDQQETARYAASGFARDMVGVLENVKRASESLSAEKRESHELLKTIGDGLDMTLQELMGIFERHGIKRIDPLGQKFDHNLHQAVVQLHQPGSEPGTVLQVVQAGYIMHDRLLKPAMVAVTKATDEIKKVDTSA